MPTTDDAEEIDEGPKMCPVCHVRTTEDVYGGPCDRCWGDLSI